MQTTQYTVYWMDNNRPSAQETSDMGEAMRLMEMLRKDPDVRAVVMAAENSNQVGNMGVDTVKDGILPDGQDYVYKTGRDRGR